MIRTVALLSTALVGLTGGAVALAAIPDADGTINGCYAKRGDLRVVDQAGACLGSESAISWNQAGVPGPQGPAGPEGPEGPQGPAGVDGASGAAELYFAAVNPEGGMPGGVGTYHTVVQKNLPAGQYLLEGRLSVHVFFGDSLLAHCGLVGDPVNAPGNRFYLTSAADTRDVEMTYALDHPGGPVSIRCHVSGGSLGVSQATLLATRVASVG